MTEIRIKGAKELEAAFMQLRREVLAEIRPALREITETVRVDAEQRSMHEISHIGATWSRMRIGLVVKGAYVAPKSRRRGGSPRRNLAGLLDRAMQEAVDAKQDEVFRRLEEVVSTSASRAGF